MSEAHEVFGYSIDEPRAWPWDGDLTRRAEVLDYNFNPPRLVRRCGYQPCLRCREPFWSEDVKLIRLCAPCKGAPRVDLYPDDATLEKRREYNRVYYQARKETWNRREPTKGLTPATNR